MLAVIGYHAGDLNQAEWLAAWMRELGPYPNHELLVARDKSTDARPFSDVGFVNVEEIVITDDAWASWPTSANNVFKKIAKHVEYTTPQPFLFLEPDVVPMRAGWLDEIEAEYKVALAAGKRFMGALVSVHQPGLDVPDHCSGVAVYPGEMTTHAGKATIALEIPWDLEAADQIIPLAHFTPLIQHRGIVRSFADGVWTEPETKPFASIEDVRAQIGPQVALYHSCKSGNLIELLRAERNKTLSGGVRAPSPETIEAKQDGDASRPTGVARSPIVSPAGSMAPPAQSFSGPVHNQTAGEASSPGPETLTQKRLEQIRDALILSDGSQVPIMPWHSRAETEGEINRLCAELKRFCGAPMHTAQVRKALKKAKVIK